MATGVAVDAVTFDNVNAYRISNLSASTPRAYLDVASLTGKSTLTFSFYAEEGTGNLFGFRVKPYSSQYVYINADTYPVGQWNTVTLDLATLEVDGTFTEFAFHLLEASTIYVKDITVS